MVAFHRRRQHGDLVSAVQLQRKAQARCPYRGDGFDDLAKAGNLVKVTMGSSSSNVHHNFAKNGHMSRVPGSWDFCAEALIRVTLHLEVLTAK